MALATFILIPKPFFAEETALGEKIRDVSPDQKFALRISYDQKENERIAAQAKNDPGEHPLPDGMFSRAVTEIDLVSLPAKEKIVELYKPDLGMNFGDITLLWTTDSRWFAFYCTELRTGYTSVFNGRDGKFVKLADYDKLHVKFNADIRSEWVSPIKWVKPGVLILQHEASGKDHVKFEFTATMDPQGKVHLSNQKKLKVNPDTD
jgi:hypothetical protein